MNYLHNEAKEGKKKKSEKGNPIRAMCYYTVENEKEQQI